MSLPLLIFIISTFLSATTSHKDITYDYVVVGAGPGGLSCASRIVTRCSSQTVAVIEEGQYPLDPKISNARNWISILFDTIIERGYTTVPQAALNNRVIWQPRAKVCGGCNSHNAMVWVLGNPRDYDGWGQVNPGWSWRDLSPYWDYIVAHWNTTHLTNDVYMQRIIQIGLNQGFVYNPDINNFTANGPAGVSRRYVSAVLDTPPDGRRVSVWTQFIQPLFPKENLDFFVNSRANRVLFSGIKAIGVEIVDAVTGKITNIMARKEVILAGGAFDTPKLLMLSGIGPKQELETFGIRVLFDVPGVGKNLQDHTFVPLASPPLVNQSDVPDTPLGVWGALITLEDGSRYWGLGLGSNFVNPLNVLSIFCETFHYKSRGTVTLRSSHPADAPVIDPKYLSEPDDITKTLETVKRGRQFIYDSSFSPYIQPQAMEISPGGSVDTDAKLIEWIKNTASTDFHPAGTCKMGQFSTDPNAVVDHRLRVRGVQNLRVADASIMPELISGNPNQATLIIGLKAADMILQDNKCGNGNGSEHENGNDD